MPLLIHSVPCCRLSILDSDCGPGISESHATPYSPPAFGQPFRTANPSHDGRRLGFTDMRLRRLGLPAPHPARRPRLGARRAGECDSDGIWRPRRLALAALKTAHSLEESRSAQTAPCAGRELQRRVPT